MGTQPSRLENEGEGGQRGDRDESPLPRASDEANAFEDADLYSESRAKGEPRLSSPMPSGLPSTAPDAGANRTSLPDGLPRYHPQPPHASQLDPADEFASSVKAEPEENLRSSARKTPRPRRFRAINVNSEGRQLPRQVLEEDALYSQLQSSATDRKRKEKGKISKSSKRRKPPEVQPHTGDDEDQLPTPEVTDSLVSADDTGTNTAEKYMGAIGQITEAESLPPAPSTRSKKTNKRKAAAKQPPLDLEEDPIAESQEVDVPASLPPSRKRKDSSQGTPGHLKPSKKRKASAPPEPVEDFDDSGPLAMHPDEVIEETQETDTPRSPAANKMASPQLEAESQRLDPDALLEQRTNEPGAASGGGSPGILAGWADDSSPDEQEPPPQPPTDPVSGNEDSVLAHPPSPSPLASDHSAIGKAGHRKESSEIGHHDEAALGSSKSGVVHLPVNDGHDEHDRPTDQESGLVNLSLPVQPDQKNRQADGLLSAGNRDSSDRDESCDGHERASELDEMATAAQPCNTKVPPIPGSVGMHNSQGPRTLSDKLVGSPDQPSRKSSLLKTLARRPKTMDEMGESLSSPGATATGEGNDAGEIDQDPAQARPDIPGNEAQESQAAAMSAAIAHSSSQTKRIRTYAKRRPKVPYFDREQTTVTPTQLPKGGVVNLPDETVPLDPRLTVNGITVAPSSTSVAIANDTGGMARVRTPSPRAHPQSGSRKATRQGNRAAENHGAVSEEAMADQSQGERAMETEPSPKYRAGALSPREESMVMDAVSHFMQERGVTMEEAIKIIQQNPKSGTYIHRQFWEAVEKACPSRKRQKLIDWCRKRYHNFVARGIWTDEQDVELQQKVEQYGQKWTLIGKEISRHPNDVRDRYRNYVACGEKQHKDYWREDEEDRLREVVSQCLKAIEAVRRLEGNINDDRTNEDCLDWSIISQKMDNTRSRRQCLQKWKQLRELDEIGQCVNVLGSSSWRLDRAREDLRNITPQNKFMLVDAIRRSKASKETKIAWKDITNTLFDQQYQKATLAICWGRLRRTVPGWRSKTTAACAEYIWKAHKTLGKIDVAIGDSDADSAEEENIIATVTPGLISSQPGPSSSRSTDRERVHRTPRELLFSGYPTPVIGSAPINKKLRATAPVVKSLGAQPTPGPNRSPQSRPHGLGTQGASPASRLESSIVSSSGTPMSAAERLKPYIGNHKSIYSKDQRHRPNQIQAQHRILSADKVGPGDSDSEDGDVEGDIPPASSIGHGPDSGDKEIDDQESVELGLEDSRASVASSEKPGSVDLSQRLTQSTPSRRDKPAMDKNASSLSSRPRSPHRTGQHAQTDDTTQSPPMTLSRFAAEMYSRRKRPHIQEDSDISVDDFRTKRPRRNPSPLQELLDENSDSGEVSRDDGSEGGREEEEISESDVESEKVTGQSMRAGVESNAMKAGVKADSSSASSESSENARDPKRAAVKASLAIDNNDGESSSSRGSSDSNEGRSDRKVIRTNEGESESESESETSSDNESRGERRLIRTSGSPRQAAVIQGDDDNSESDSESNMEDMDDIPARLPGSSSQRRVLPIDDEAEDDEDEDDSESNSDEDEEDEESEESDPEKLDEEPLVDQFQSDSDDDYVDP